MKKLKRKIASWLIKLAELILLDDKFPRLLVYLGNKLDPTTNNYNVVVFETESRPTVVRNRHRR